MMQRISEQVADIAESTIEERLASNAAASSSHSEEESLNLLSDEKMGKVIYFYLRTLVEGLHQCERSDAGGLVLPSKLTKTSLGIQQLTLSHTKPS